MKLRLAENIRAFRKERKLTQEQLAESLSVTVGAVSKWESAASTPDISLIVGMAELFETSVDVLLGYDWKSGGMGLAAARIRALRNEKKFDEACAEAEKALQKYPNAFEIVFQSAILYSMKGIEKRCQKSFRRALSLFERSLELIGQNDNPRISEWTIRNSIAEIYLELDQTERALERLRANNADGLNDAAIGRVLAIVSKKPDEALPYLSDALDDLVSRLFQVITGLANAYGQKNDHESALAAFLWMRGLVDGLRLPGKPSYLDLAATSLASGCALAAAHRNDAEAVRQYLREARALAEGFDAAPAYGLGGTRFYHGDGSATAFTDFGETAMEGIRRSLKQEDETDEMLQQIWNEVCREVSI